MSRLLTIEIDEETDAVIRRQAAIEGSAPEVVAARWMNQRCVRSHPSQTNNAIEAVCEKDVSIEREAELEQFVHDFVKQVRREKRETMAKS